MVGVYFKDKKLRLMREHHTSSLDLQQQMHQLEQQRESRRQNSERAEMERRDAADDEYHKIITLNLAAAIMFIIWFQVMNISLFSQTPFAFLSTLEDIPAPSFFSSISFFSSYVSWGFFVKLLQGAAIIAVLLLIWTFMSRLAPYVTFCVIFIHFWQSIARAAAYFVAYWGFVSLTFLFPLRHKKLRLAILYTINLVAAAIVGGLVARGDELNPYRVSYLQDRLAETLVTWFINL